MSPATVARARAIATVVVLLGCTALLGFVVNKHQAIGSWLVFRYLACWAAMALFALSSLSFGHLLVEKLAGKPRDLLGHVALSFAVGVVAFGTAVFLTGLARGLSGFSFLAIPAVFLAASARSSVALVRRVAGHLRHAPRRPVSALHLAAFAAGVCGIALLYLPVLTPAHIGYDSRWYHLPIAEHYAATGRIERLGEGWYPGTGPHLSSLLYAWALTAPWVSLFTRVEMTAHLEFVVYLASIAAVPALVRRVVPRADARLSWLAWFLFPTVWLCDVNVGGDHVAGLFAVPIALALLTAIRSLSAGNLAVLMLVVGGALNTKYTALSIALAPCLVVLALGLRALARSAREGGPALKATTRALAIGVAVLLLTTSIVWLKNLLWYRNPFYPSAASLFKPVPWHADAAAVFEAWKRMDLVHPPRTLEGQLETLKATADFSFRSFDGAWYAKNRPMIGSLFSLLSLCLLFVGGVPRRLWVLVGIGHAGVFVWYSLHHQERYLQTMLPLFAATTAGAIAVIWRSGKLVRAPLVLLVALQLLWGSDAYAFPTHTKWVNALVDLLSSGFTGKMTARERPEEPWQSVGEKLPPRSKVLIHEMHEHFGIWAATVNDFGPWQGGLNYGRLGSPAAVARVLTKLGVTHIAYGTTSKGYDSLGSDLAFYDLVISFGTRPDHVGGITLVTLPTATMPEAPLVAAVFLCDKTYASGLYDLRSLNAIEFAGKPSAPYPAPQTPLADASSLFANKLEGARYLVQKADCGGAIPEALKPSLKQLATRRDAKLWVVAR